MLYLAGYIFIKIFILLPFFMDFMPFAYSIATGIMFGILTWVILKIVTGKIKEIHPIMWVAFALFAVRIVTLICGVSS